MPTSSGSEPSLRSPSRSATANGWSDGLVNLALLLGLGFLPGVAHQVSGRFLAAYLALGLLFVLGRSLWWLWAGTLVAAIAHRMLPVDLWVDQTFVQLSSLAELLSGHGIYDPATGIGQTWSIYLPMGNLLAALPVWFLGAKFWLFFQALVPLVLSIPFLLAPSQRTFRLFLGLVAFVPFAELTSRGNALEISVAVLFAGFWLLLRGREPVLAGALVGYGVLLRQPLLFAAPFAALAWYRERSRAALFSLASVLVLGGLVHVVRNPIGFFTATVGQWPDFADQWFHKLGARSNYSFASILFYLGDQHALDRERQTLYFVALGLALAILVVVAWRARTLEAAVGCGIAATLLAHLLSRGFVQFHYIAAAAMPALAFVGHESERSAERTRPVARLAVLAATVAIAALVVAPLVLAAVGSIRSMSSSEGAPVELVGLATEGPITLPDQDVDGAFARRLRLDVRVPLSIELEREARPSELTLIGPKIPRRLVDGVELVYPTELEVVGFLRSGRVEGSLDGSSWRPLARFRTWVHPSFFPSRIALATDGEPVRFLRILDGATWWGQNEWLLGGVVVREAIAPRGAARSE